MAAIALLTATACGGPAAVPVPRSGPCDESGRTCRTLLSAQPKSGNGDLGEFKADGSTEHWIYLNCLGQKSVVVELTPEPTFEIPCGDDWPEVAVTHNQFDAGALKEMSYRVGVKAPADVEWSLTVVSANRP